MSPRSPHVPDFEARLLQYEKATQEIAEREVVAFAVREAEAFRSRILEQKFYSFRNPVLRDITVALKKRYGLDARTMIATETYVHAIGVFKNSTPVNGAKNQYVISIPLGAKAISWFTRQPREVSLQYVAKWQELGTSTKGGSVSIPARPHWGPYLQELKTRAPAVRDKIKKQVVERMAKSRIP